MNWRELIHQFLIACAEDDRTRALTESQSKRSQFLEKFGTDSLSQLEAERVRLLILRSQKSLGSPNSYQIVEESTDLIIAEVEPAPNGHPYRLTRFRLERCDGQWKLEDYLWQCQCTDGKCGWCDGTGICSVCEGEGECKFCDGQYFCQLCKGDRRCSICKEGTMPGWNSMTRPSK